MTLTSQHRDELSPCYSWYPRDWRASHSVTKMSWKERGFYRECLDWAWDMDGLPNDLEEIRDRLRASPRDFALLWPSVNKHFPLAADGRLRNPRQELERAKQQKFKRRSSDGAKARWDKPQADASSTCLSPAEADALSNAVPSLSLLHVPVPVPTAEGSKAIVDDDLGQRGARLVGRYGELYAQYRHGARHRQRPNLDWVDACDLCRNWPDDRLEKLAILVLTTDDAWISRTDRSFKIFAMKATWADDRLRQWETEHGVAV